MDTTAPTAPAAAPAPVSAAELLSAADDLRKRAESLTVPASSDPAVKPGIKTTEFALAAGAFVLGVYLILSEKNVDLGAQMLAYATGGYALSRVLVKSKLGGMFTRK